MERLSLLRRFSLLLVLALGGVAWGQRGYDRYLTPAEVEARLERLVAQGGDHARLVSLALTPGGRKVWLLEIGKEISAARKHLPAILVVGDPEGDVPLAPLGALYVAQQLLETPGLFARHTWYIIPSLNPDAEMHFFNKPRCRDPRNARPVNDDLDEATDEDGYDDLNGDGLITMMRVPDPQGSWVVMKKDARLMRKANPVKGEKGEYKLYTEGLDNDGDGQYNEDGPGGTNVGINFPHLFRPHRPDGGLWPGSAPEAFALMKFVTGHPEIAMVMFYGSTDFCRVPPKGGRKGAVDLNRIKLPKDVAKQFGADPDKTYTMKELIEMVKAFVPAGMEITESDIASFLGLGAMVNPLPDDLKYYRELAEKYKEYLKEQGMDQERLDPAPAKDGSPELWVYYQIGVPVFSMNFWTLPKPQEEKKEEEGKDTLTTQRIGKMSKEDFLALEDEKLNAYLKAVKAPPQFDAKKVKAMVQGGQLTPKKIAEMIGKMGGGPDEKGEEKVDPKMKALLAFADAHPGWQGYIPWQPYEHPDLGKVEIGGMVPYADNTPPATMIDSLLRGQVPWVFTLADSLAQLHIEKTKVEPRGGGVYQLTVWLSNDGYLPFPTAMGKKNQHVPPAVVQVIGNVAFLEGRDWTPVNSLAGKSVKKLSWLLHADKPASVEILLTSPNAGGDKRTIKIGGAS